MPIINTIIFIIINRNNLKLIIILWYNYESLCAFGHDTPSHLTLFFFSFLCQIIECESKIVSSLFFSFLKGVGTWEQH